MLWTHPLVSQVLAFPHKAPRHALRRKLSEPPQGFQGLSTSLMKGETEGAAAETAGRPAGPQGAWPVRPKSPQAQAQPHFALMMSFATTCSDPAICFQCGVHPCPAENQAGKSSADLPPQSPKPPLPLGIHRGGVECIMCILPPSQWPRKSDRAQRALPAIPIRLLLLHLLADGHRWALMGFSIPAEGSLPLSGSKVLKLGEFQDLRKILLSLSSGKLHAVLTTHTLVRQEFASLSRCWQQLHDISDAVTDL